VARGIRRWYRHTLAKFFLILESELVEFYQWIFYAIISFDGAQNLFIAHAPPLTLQGSMSVHPWFEFWCALEMVAPACGLVGRLLSRNHDDDIKDQADLFQFVGDSILGTSEIAYVIGTFHIEPIGKGGHGGYLGLAFTLSAYTLAAADARRLFNRRQWRARAGEICLGVYQDAVGVAAELR
jgi:hypothetical protein